MAILIYPEYVKNFTCIASACQHTCCAGWEIDIDEDSLLYYQSLPGAMGDRLRASIEEDHFRLDEEERCPFLRQDGLCDMVLELGEDSLCQICSDHPRFYNFYEASGTLEEEGDMASCEVEELGIGMACEEAGRLILSGHGLMLLLIREENQEERVLTDSEIMSLPIASRQLLMKRVEEAGSIDDAMDLLCPGFLSEVKLPHGGLSLIDEFLNLEINEASWRENLIDLERNLSYILSRRADFLSYYAAEPSRGCCTNEYKQLIYYLLYRYESTYGDDMASLGRFICKSVFLIQLLDTWKWCRSLILRQEEQVEICRAFSEEIEYCIENVDALMR